MSSKSVFTRVPYKSALEECQVRVPSKKCQVRVSSQSVK